MTLLEQVKADQLVARKSAVKNRNDPVILAKETIVSNVLGTVLSGCEALSMKSKDGRVVLSDSDVVGVIQIIAKGVAETITLIANNADRADELAKLQQEKATLSAYLPQQLTTEELTAVAVHQHSLGLNLGQIMAHLKAEYAGKYDAKAASGIVRGVTAP